jgi:hypothetical protein
VTPATATTATVALPTADELVTTILEHLDYAAKALDKPLTPTRIHAIRNHHTVMKGDLCTLKRLNALGLLTPPCRPEETSQ